MQLFGWLELSQLRLTTCDPIEQAALVTYVTAGYPKADDTPEIMLAMERGGSGELQLLAPPSCRLCASC